MRVVHFPLTLYILHDNITRVMTHDKREECMLAIALIFVGITLVGNGICMLQKVDAKSMIVLNVICAFVLITGNLIELSKATDMIAYTNVASGLLFGITYALIAVSIAFQIDETISGWYSIMVAIYALIMGVQSIQQGSFQFAYLWFAWSILWGSTFVENVLKKKVRGFTPILCIVEGIAAAFVPAILMMLGVF